MQITTEKPEPLRAVSLLSGGLDSLLAIRALQMQGIEVHALVFQSLFFSSVKGVAAAKQLTVPLIVEDFSQRILSLIKNPRHGFGVGLNPCLDCHIAMIRRAGQIMDAQGFHLISTGEVLNQRPMSQNRQALELIARESGYGERLLRPLSAKLLPATTPEKLGWVDRQQFFAIEGRSRKAQMVLAMKMGLREYPQPAGGCLLADPGYARRLQELKEHEGLDAIEAIARLRLGRHFRLGRARLILGRNQDENARLQTLLRPEDISLQPTNCVGPFGLLDGMATEENILRAAAFLARYSDVAPALSPKIAVARGGQVQIFTPLLPAQEEISAARI